jgi:hypothetical protein
MAEQARSQVSRIPGRKRRDAGQQRHQERRGGEASEAQHRDGDRHRRHGEPRRGHAEDGVQVQPEEQRVAAQQGAQQRSDGVPAVELSRRVPQLPELAAQVVEDQRQRRAGERHGQADHRQHGEEGRQVEGVEVGGMLAEQDSQPVRVVGSVLEQRVETHEAEQQQPQVEHHQAPWDAG